MTVNTQRDALDVSDQSDYLRRWHADLSDMASEAKPADMRLAASKLAHVHVALLSLVPAARTGQQMGELKAMAPWVRAALMDASVDSLHYLLDGAGQSAAQRTYQRMADVQDRCADQVAAQLQAEGITPLIFKGAELRLRVFGGKAVSSSTDVDVLVRPACIERARGVLHGMGFIHARYDPVNGCLVEVSPEKLSSHEKTHRELYPLCRLTQVHLADDEIEFVRGNTLTPLFVHRGQGVMMEVIDLHRGLFTRMDVGALFDRAVPSVHAGAVTLSLTDHVWTTALRFYLESSSIHNDPKHRDLAYLAALLAEPGIDWDLLVKIISEADLRPAVFYPLRFLAQLRLADVPNWVLDALHVRRGSHVMDFGCRATRMLGLVEGTPAEITPLTP